MCAGAGPQVGAEVEPRGVEHKPPHQSSVWGVADVLGHDGAAHGPADEHDAGGAVALRVVHGWLQVSPLCLTEVNQPSWTLGRARVVAICDEQAGNPEPV